MNLPPCQSPTYFMDGPIGWRLAAQAVNPDFLASWRGYFWQGTGYWIFLFFSFFSLEALASMALGVRQCRLWHIGQKAWTLTEPFLFFLYHKLHKSEPSELTHFTFSIKESSFVCERPGGPFFLAWIWKIYKEWLLNFLCSEIRSRFLPWLRIWVVYH